MTEPKIKWQNSKAKDRLRDTLMSDPNHKWWMMSAHDIFQEDELLQEYPTNCADRLRRLKTAIRGNMEKIAFNNNAVTEHKRLFPSSRINNRGNLRLHGHLAKELLELDVAAGRTKGLKPAQLRETPDEYKEFTNNKQWSKAVRKRSRGKHISGQIKGIEKAKKGMLNKERHSYKNCSSCSLKLVLFCSYNNCIQYDNDNCSCI